MSAFKPHRLILGACAFALALPVQGCASGRLPDMPSRAEYDQTCPDLFAAYQQQDRKARNRKWTAYSIDSAIALTAIGITVATSGAAGPGVPIGAVILSQAKGDLGHENLTQDRAKLQQIAVRKGCSEEDVVAFGATQRPVDTAATRAGDEAATAQITPPADAAPADTRL